MTITLDVIDKSSLLDLTTELKKLDVKWIYLILNLLNTLLENIF